LWAPATKSSPLDQGVSPAPTGFFIGAEPYAELGL
jgi:hypothetical protein